MNFIEVDAEDRFKRVSEIDEGLLLESVIPTNTRKRNQWAFKILNSWNKWRKNIGQKKVDRA